MVMFSMHKVKSIKINHWVLLDTSIVTEFQGNLGNNAFDTVSPTNVAVKWEKHISNA